MAEPQHIVKLHLNAPALEALLGRSPEIIPVLTTQVIENVLKVRILKVVEDKFEVSRMQAVALKHAEDKTLERIGEITTHWAGHVTSVKLRPEMESGIRTAVRAVADQCVHDLIRKCVDEVVLTLESRIEHAVGTVVQRAVQDAVKSRVNEINAAVAKHFPKAGIGITKGEGDAS